MKLLEHLSLETDNSTKEAETEITIYAKIGNLEGLKEATSSEKQEQVEAALGQRGQFCRVRKTYKGETPGYCFTFKLKVKGHTALLDARKEHNVVVDEDFFIGFQEAADSLQLKTRYFFNAEKLTLTYGEGDNVREIEVPDVIYEVDTYTKADGTLSEYCKIDIEVDNIMTFMEHNYPEVKDIKMNVRVSNLPFNPIDPLIVDKDNNTHQAFLSHLWETEFKIKLPRDQGESHES